MVRGQFYSDWRRRSGIVPALRDDAGMPPERLLQAVWLHQRLRRDQLRTLDGQTVRVLHPGFKNVEGGPDFRDAVLQLGDNAPVSGDVEVDLRIAGWHDHRHDVNPAFGKVALHVVWDADHTSHSLPTLPLHRALDSPLSELFQWLGSESSHAFPDSAKGRCCAPLMELPPDKTTALLNDAAYVRLQSKASAFRARARDAGWEQALWEGLFRALGYKHNVWPMQRLAELRAHWSAGEKLTALQIQARLLGLSGLLPDELPRASATGKYLREIWDGWWRERDELAEFILPPSLWRFHGLRPANHPQRRLALASHWAARENFYQHLSNWCDAPSDGRVPRVPNLKSEKLTSADSLLRLLQPASDDFWSWHWTIRSTRMPKPQPLIGLTRCTDLAINVILPWLWSRANEGKNDKLQRHIEQRYFAWPAAEDNSILKLARQRLLGRARFPLRNAALQQGLIQIVRDFCEHSNAVCDHCQFPDLVRSWKL